MKDFQPCQTCPNYGKCATEGMACERPSVPAASSARSPLTYAVEQRLRMVDFLLAQYGSVKRAALMDYFGIGEATATRDFGVYHEIAPGNMALNPADKTYYRTTAFVRAWK